MVLARLSSTQEMPTFLHETSYEDELRVDLCHYAMSFHNTIFMLPYSTFNVLYISPTLLAGLTPISPTADDGELNLDCECIAEHMLCVHPFRAGDSTCLFRSRSHALPEL